MFESLELKDGLWFKLRADASRSFPQYSDTTHRKIAELSLRLLNLLISKMTLEYEEDGKINEESLWLFLPCGELNNKFVFLAKGSLDNKKFHNYKTVIDFLVDNRYIVYKNGVNNRPKQYRIDLALLEGVDTTGVELPQPRPEVGEILSSYRDLDIQCVYAIHNNLTGFAYVGSTTCLSTRLSIHVNSLVRGEGSNNTLQEAWDKDLHSNFSFKILEEVSDESKLRYREQSWIDYYYGMCYNKVPSISILELKKQRMNDNKI